MLRLRLVVLSALVFAFGVGVGCTSLLGDFTEGTEGGGADATTDQDAGGADATTDQDAAGACSPGVQCSPATCHTGVVTCDGGAQGCTPIGIVNDGVSCDAGAVCDNGSCVPCAAGSDCRDASSCQNATIACTTGSPVCVPGGNVTNGTPCGVNLYCDNGTCTPCTNGAVCVPPNNACHVGTTVCADGGAPCNDTQINVSDLTSCGSTSVCCSGACTTCNVPANATAACVGTTCSYSCTNGYQSCNGGCADYQTDSANCGSCGHSCFGGGCLSGVCQPYIVAQPPTTGKVVDLTTDGVHVLWTDSTKQSVFEVPIAGGTLVTIASGITSPEGVGVANGYVGFTGMTGGSPSNPQEWWAFDNTNNGASVMFTSGLVSDNGAAPMASFAISSDAKYTCWIDLFSATENVRCCPFVGAAGGCGVVWNAAYPTMGHQIAANSTSFFWSDPSQIFSIPFGGSPTDVVTLLAGATPDWVTADDTYAYYVDGSTTIKRVPVLGGSITTFPIASNTFTGLALDGGNLYDTYALGGVGYLGHMTNSGGSPGAIPLPDASPARVVAAKGAIVWYDASSQIIYGLRYP